MLIQFSVANFRSFRERQTLSMVAAPRLRKRQNVFKPELVGEKFPDLLKVAVIYGPNASGKSNLLKALSVIRMIASRDTREGDEPLPISPFRFDPELQDQPSQFDLHFIHAGTRYHFELHATRERIVLERLVSFPKGREMPLYLRRYTAEGESYSFGVELEGGESVFETWRKLTPPRLLFIQAATLGNEELSQLKLPFEWLRRGVRNVLDGMHGLTQASQELAEEGTVSGDEIASFLRDVDVPVTSIRVESKKKLDAQSLGASDSKKQMTLTHSTALGNAELSLAEQSDGTKNLIGFWLPWSIKDSTTLPGRVLAVDELDSSLHPMIVVALVEKHLSSSFPTQLIFTTHDTHLMDAKVLRRDQFWITERDLNGATQLRSIHEFDGRESEDIEKRYFEGRYRGLPFVNRG